MSTRVPVEKAKFTPQSGSDQSPILVDFNPISLQFSVSNTLKEEGSGKTKKQYVSQGTGKLSMDLIFDNTATGSDVRLSTSRLAALMQPDPKSSGADKQVPVIVLFEWGSYKFKGMLESYKETLDYFAPQGVPLRSSVSLGLVEQDAVFSASDAGQANTAGDLNTVDIPGGQFSASLAASAGGNPGAARAIAALNGEASLRFTSGASLTVSGSVTLSPPVAFATGGAGIGIGIGGSIGLGGSVGIGIGASVGVSAGANLSAGGALFGSSASAGVTASQGAFAGLRVSSAPSVASVDTGRFMRVSESVAISTSGADFSVGGQAVATGTAGLSADVGANADLRARIQFEVE